MWRQRARINWIKQGDLNTAFCHKMANTRNRKNTILRLESQEEIIKDEDRIKGHIHEHFKSLFGSRSEHRCLGASRTVGFGQSFISKPFSEEEIKAAVWRLGKQGTRARRLSNFLLSSFLRYCEA